MIECLLYRTNTAQRRLFYRVEIAMNLFNEVSVMREWGFAGSQPKAIIQCFGNLREASRVADRYRTRAERRGYLRHRPQAIHGLGQHPHAGNQITFGGILFEGVADTAD